MVSHETRIREVPGSNPVGPANLVEVFGGFFNLQIAKELVIFKGKWGLVPRPGDYIVHGPTDVSHHRWVASTHGSRRTWPGDYFGHGPIDICHG